MAGVSTMAHVGHGQYRTWIELRQRCMQAFAHCEYAGREARAPHILRKDCECVLPCGRNDHIQGLGNSDAKLIDAHRMDVLTVSCHHGHPETRDPYVEVRHR